MSKLHELAKAILEKGILAADESAGTMNKRLESIDVAPTEKAKGRLEWRQILATTENLEKYISGVILSDDIVRTTAGGIGVHEVFAEKSIIPGIKVDAGAKVLANYPREKVTEGLDGLRERLAEYAAMGLKFAKWRAVLDVIPSVACVQANAHALARYAALCQEAGLVPIVEPEVLMDGGHHIEVARTATEAALHATFDALHWQGVDLRGIILKPNMVLWGYDHEVAQVPGEGKFAEAADYTLGTLYNCVPASVPGIAFLSGGQPDDSAVKHLRLMNATCHPWRITYSYGRALQGPALREWAGNPENVESAQEVLLSRSKEVFDACSSKHT